LHLPLKEVDIYSVYQVPSHPIVHTFCMSSECDMFGLFLYQAKKKLLEAIDTYIREQIEVAAQAICIMVQRKIADGDVILTYGW